MEIDGVTDSEVLAAAPDLQNGHVVQIHGVPVRELSEPHRRGVVEQRAAIGPPPVTNRLGGP